MCGHPAEAAICSACTARLFDTEQQLAEPVRIGDYELGQLLGEGGMGQVYLACSAQTDTLVALKLARAELIGNDAGLIAFRRELESTQQLNHPNIVRIHALGSHEGRPYLVMDLIDGGTLGERGPGAGKENEVRALSLVTKIAHAVQHAHVRGFLHCDLKPANILLDSIGEPYVSDFGLARALRLTEHPFVVGGSPGWMAPEQVREETTTVQTDVFALGLLLWWLLTGCHAFGCDDDFQERVLSQAPLEPSRALRWELRSICERALQKSPDARYPSAGELARDLTNVQAGLPISAEQPLRFRRLSKWVRRHVVASVLGVELILLLVYLALLPNYVLSDFEAVVRSNNEYAAKIQAGNVANELRLRSDRVLDLASKLSLRDELTRCDLSTPSPTLALLASEFDNVWAFTASGTPCRSWPHPAANREPSYDWRDYFIGQAELAATHTREIYIAKVIRDDIDAELKLAYSTPIFDEHGHVAGALVATTMTRSTFGSVQMNCSGKGNCMTALLASRDIDNSTATRSKRLIVVAEPGLEAGREVSVPAHVAKRICQHLGCEPQVLGALARSTDDRAWVEEDYLDPVSGERSLAAIASVAHTGMSVLVATPHDGIVTLLRTVQSRTRAWMWVPLSFGLALVVLVIGITAEPVRSRTK